MLSPGTFVQYHLMQAKQVWPEIYQKKSMHDEIEEVVHEEELFILL
jgi:hypothetical protein